MADQATEGLLSPFLRRQRIKAALPHLYGRILDMGCGSGALAAHLPPSRYVGLDRDEESISIAKANFPQHSFILGDKPHSNDFDTIVALAIIEHVPDPAAFLSMLCSYLSQDRGGIVVCTTPHPAVDWVHTTGSRIGLFSRSANDEHEELLDRPRLKLAGQAARVELIYYGRFLGGANQVAVFSAEAISRNPGANPVSEGAGGG